MPGSPADRHLEELNPGETTCGLAILRKSGCPADVQLWRLRHDSVTARLNFTGGSLQGRRIGVDGLGVSGKQHIYVHP